MADEVGGWGEAAEEPWSPPVRALLGALLQPDPQHQVVQLGRVDGLGEEGAPHFGQEPV